METTNSIIEQIHHEASTAEQELLKEASRILEQASNKETMERMNQLQALGFNNFKEAVELSPEKVAKVKELKELIGLYRIKAPTAKFMTDEAVKELCLKYGLVQAPVGCYIDRIPERNQQEIVNFKIDPEFLRNSFMQQVEVGKLNLSINSQKWNLNFAQQISGKKNIQVGKQALDAILFIVKNWEDSATRSSFGTDRRTGIFSQEEGTKEQVFRKYSDIILSALKVALHHGAVSDEDFNIINPMNFFQTYGNHALVYDAVARFRQGRNSQQMELRIIAPKHMLNLEDYEINENCQAIPKGYEHVAPQVKAWFEQDDPIVQVKVNGGWLNITAWGAEAQHPESFNESLN